MKFFLFHEELQLFVVKFKYKAKNTRIQKMSERSKICVPKNHNLLQRKEITAISGINATMKKFFILLMGKGKKTR